MSIDYFKKKKMTSYTVSAVLAVIYAISLVRMVFFQMRVIPGAFAHQPYLRCMNQIIQDE